MLDTFLKAIQTDLAFYQSIGLLLFAIILSSLINIPRKHQPLFYFTELAKAFSKRVNRSERSSQQRAIAGTLAAIFLVFPIWFIITFFIELAAYPLFFETLILLMCLTNNGLLKESKNIAVAIHESNTNEAKSKLALWCQRDTSTLTAVGLSKTCIEKMVQIASTTTGLVIFSFIIGGAELTLLLTLLKQLDYAWPHLDNHYRAFGAFAFIINRVVNFVPYSLYLLIYSVSNRNAFKQLFKSTSSQGDFCAKAIELSAVKLQIELGGPRIYKKNKQPTPKYKFGGFPTAHHIIEAQQKLGSMNLITIAGLMIYLAIHFAISL